MDQDDGAFGNGLGSCNGKAPGGSGLVHGPADDAQLRVLQRQVIATREVEQARVTGIGHHLQERVSVTWAAPRLAKPCRTGGALGCLSDRVARQIGVEFELRAGMAGGVGAGQQHGPELGRCGGFPGKRFDLE